MVAALGAAVVAAVGSSGSSLDFARLAMQPAESNFVEEKV